MVYQRKSGTDGKLKTIAVCLTALLLSLASFDQAWAVVTNQNTIPFLVFGFGYKPKHPKYYFGFGYNPKHMQNQNNILIHCKEGVGRSSLIIIAYLITTGLDLFESMKIVQSNRWGANLNNIQFQKLKKWYELYNFS